MQKRDELPGAARMEKPGILTETAADAAPSLLYSCIYLDSTELSALAAL